MFVPGSLSWVPTDLPTVPFVFLAPAEALWQNVKVAGLFALVLATPYILLEVWQFVVPGLHAQERRFVGPFVALSTVAFYAGVGFSFFFVLPFALNFFVSYGVSAGFIPQLSIAQYVGFALWFLMVFGLILKSRWPSPSWPNWDGLMRPFSNAIASGRFWAPSLSPPF